MNSSSYPAHVLALDIKNTLQSIGAQKGFAGAVGTISAIVVLAAMMTTGQSAAYEAQVLSSIDAVGPRTFVVRDVSGTARIMAGATDRISGVEGVEEVSVFGPVYSARNSVLQTEPITVRTLLGSTSNSIVLTGNYPGAYLSPGAMATAQFSEPIGDLRLDSTRRLPVAGQFQVGLTLDVLANEALWLVPSDSNVSPRLAIVTAATVGDLSRAKMGTLAVLGAHDPGELIVEDSAELAELQRVLGGQATAYGRSALLQILAFGGLVMALTVFSHTHAQRTSFGRRRALGASRSQLTRLVVMQVLVAALGGGILGGGLGLLGVFRLTGVTVPVAFGLAVIVLGAMTSALCALPPSVLAATRDPVAVLRQP